MKQIRFFATAALGFFSLCAFSASLHADTIDRDGDREEVDVQALREWINTKRQVTVKEIGGNLSISGEVRTEFQSTGETKDGISQRGSEIEVGDGKYAKFPPNTFDVAANLMLDYRSDLTWASFKLEFDNDAGIVAGTNNKIKLSRAYFGARAIDGDSAYLDFEIGRRKLSAVFDSKLEFNSVFDGVLVKYDHSFDRVGDFYVHLGAFVINEKKSQYGYVGETGFMNIASTGLYTKYSLIDWDTRNIHTATQQRLYDFLVSQFILGYKFYPANFQKQVTIYSGVLYNSKARKLEISNNEKANWGSYIGFNIGELKRKGDWALDANYQVIQAQCVPDYDMNGIGLGNVANTGFYTKDINGEGEPVTEKANAAGNGNFKGFCITLDYLLTNNINVQQQWNYATTLDHNIGPDRRFKQYEIEFIYGF